MPQGYYTFERRDASRLPQDQAYWDALPPHERLMLAESGELVERQRTKNLVMDNMAGMLLHHTQSSAPALVPASYSNINQRVAVLNMSNDSSEPTYTEEYVTGGTDRNDMQFSINGTDASKYLIVDQVTPFTIESFVPLDGREGAHFQNKLLYIPSEAVGSIYSFAIWSRDNASMSTPGNNAIVTRVRLKNSAGDPIVINKTASETLLVQWDFYMLSV